MDAVRDSHLNSSYGVFPASNRAVKWRGNSTPTLSVTGTGRRTSFSFIATPTPSCPIGLVLRARIERQKGSKATLSIRFQKPLSAIVPQDLAVRQELYLYGVQPFADLPFILAESGPSGLNL